MAGLAQWLLLFSDFIRGQNMLVIYDDEKIWFVLTN